MAIDTANEKLALITYQQMWNTPVPISSDGIGQDDRQHLLAQYPGILYASPSTAVSGSDLLKIVHLYRQFRI